MENIHNDSSSGRTLSHSEKLSTSTAIWYCSFTLGLGVSFLGTSLLELSDKFQQDVSYVSKVFSVLTFSFLTGALVWGIIYNYLNRQIVCSILLILMGLGTSYLALAPSPVLFFCAAGLAGFTGGGFDTAQIVWIIELWATKAAPYIQIQHFSYAVGTLISPLLVKPFLTNVHKDTANQTKGEAIDYTSSQDNISLEYSPSVVEDYVKPQAGEWLHIPFLIGGAASIFGGLLLLSLACCFSQKGARLTRANKKRHDDDGPRANSIWKCSAHDICLIALSAIFLGAYCGMEISSMQFLPTFTHFIPLQLSSSDGALILSGLTGAFTLGRGLGIFVVLKILPEVILLGNAILVFVGNSLLYFFSGGSYTILWVGSILMGIGYSTVFPAYYGFIEKHLQVSNTVGAIMIMSGGLVSSGYPIIIGSFIETHPYTLLHTNYVSLVICVFTFAVIYWVVDSGKNGSTSSQVYISGQVVEENKM